jgi:hypothetical protein
MKEVLLNVPMLGFAVSTRVALGIGIGLLVSGQLPATRRRAIGRALVALGAATTIPIIATVVRGTRRSGDRLPGAVSRDARLVGATRFPRKGDDI